MHIVNVFELKNKLLYFLPIALDFSPEFSILIDSVVLIVSRHNWFPAKIRWMLENHQNHHIIVISDLAWPVTILLPCLIQMHFQICCWIL